MGGDADSASPLKRMGRKARKHEKKTLTSFAAVAIEAQIRAKRKELGWRGPKEYACRITLAWLFNFLVPGICYLYAIILSIKFGEAQTANMILTWLIAYGWTFLLVEPAQVLILAGTPCMFNEETKCGRCCVRARFVYNEL